jgi:hypothetical protein
LQHPQQQQPHAEDGQCKSVVGVVNAAAAAAAAALNSGAKQKATPSHNKETSAQSQKSDHGTINENLSSNEGAKKSEKQ